MFGNDTGDVAADHYHLYEQDIKLMVALGIKHYRCTGVPAGTAERWGSSAECSSGTDAAVVAAQQWQ